jgi:predicted RND superfamily exporter protein
MAGVIALVVVFLVILIDFRSLRSSVLAMVPLLMGAIWMAGAMGPLGLEFNLANLIVLPLILGIGVVNGVHVVHRYRERPGAIVDIIWGSTGKAVLLTSLTTILGCGALGVFSHHPGLSSLGYVLSLGVAACLLTSWLALPPLMQIFYRTARRASRKKARRRRKAKARLRG